MKTLINHKQTVNGTLQTVLFAFSLIMHRAASSVAVSHPLLGWLLAMMETIGWLAILTIWGIALIKGIRDAWPKLWTKIQTYAHTHGCIKQAKHTPLVVLGEQIVSQAQLKHAWSNVQRLRLALHGLTPEMENARRQHFEMLGEAIPDLTVPLQNAALYAEFIRLTQLLNHFGFPHLESVRLQHKELAFVQKWGSDLETRLQQTHTHYASQQQAMQQMLNEACKTFEHLSSQYQQVHKDAGYQRIQGALKLLQKMACTSTRPEEVMSYLSALLQDMERLHAQFTHVAA